MNRNNLSGQGVLGGIYLAIRTNHDQWFPVAVARPLALAVSILLLSGGMTAHAAGVTFPVEFMLGDLTGTNGFRLDGAAEGDRSGNSVSGAGDVNGDGINDFIIGAPGADPSGNSDAGSAYVVFGRDMATEGAFPATLVLGDLTGMDGFQIDGEAADDRAGWSVSTAGDINADGIDDLIGSSAADPNGDSGGDSSYVVFGRDTATEGIFQASLALGDLTGTNGFRLDGEAAASDFNAGSVSAAGDINGDGIDDLIVGDLDADPDGILLAGSSYVVFGRDTATEGAFPATLALGDLTGTDGFRIDGEAAGDRSGWPVSAAGDINGDGIDDLIIGAQDADPNGNLGAGSSYVIFGRNTATDGTFPAKLALGDLTGANGFRMDGEAAGDGSGNSVSGARDINGDGIDDLMVGSPGGKSGAGSIYVIFGRNTLTDGTFPAKLALGDLTGTNGFRMDGEAASEENGTRVSGAGDINGDGIDDLIIGAPGADWNGTLAGRSYVVFGRNAEQEGAFPGILALGDLAGTDGFRIDGESAYDYFGGSVGNAGDINGDGINDLVFGAPQVTPDNTDNAGISYVVFGGITGPGEIPALTLTPSILNFGDLAIGAMAIETLIAENTDTGLLEVGTLSIQGVHAGDFSIEMNGCGDVQLAQGESCDIDIGFSPTAPGIREATLRAESNAPSSPDSAPLHGSNDILFTDGFE